MILILSTGTFNNLRFLIGYSCVVESWIAQGILKWACSLCAGSFRLNTYKESMYYTKKKFWSKCFKMQLMQVYIPTASVDLQSHDT